MKKPYIYPEALVVGLSAVSPLAGSNPDIKLPLMLLLLQVMSWM
jgi:hypothetical protein